MKRVRQESAEVYEVTGLEIVKALGIWTTDDDRVFIERVPSREGDVYKIKVEFHEEETVELDAPDNRTDFCCAQLPVGLDVVILGDSTPPPSGLGFKLWDQPGLPPAPVE